MRVILAAFAATLCAACGGPVEDPSSWAPGRPRIDDIQYLGQSPTDPLGLRFSIRFIDSDGDLGPGRLWLSVDDAEASEIGLAEVFAAQSPALPEDATDGEVEVKVQLAETPEDGERITVGFTFEDGSGRRSNSPSLTLEAG